MWISQTASFSIRLGEETGYRGNVDSESARQAGVLDTLPAFLWENVTGFGIVEDE